MPKDNARRVGSVQFADGIEIAKSDLDRAIGGGLKRGNLSRASRQQREDVVSIIYLMLVAYFARGKTLEGTVGSLAFKIAYRVAIDSHRRPDAYEKRRCYGVDVSEAAPMADALTEAPNAEEVYLDREGVRQRNRKLSIAVKTLSETDRNALIDAIDRKVALERNTMEKIKLANLISQREKRAKDRLVKAYRAFDEAR